MPGRAGEGKRDVTRVVVHRIVFARGVDPDVVIIPEGDQSKRLVVDEVRRLRSENDEIAVKVLGHYEHAPSRRVTLDSKPEAAFTVEPSTRQLRAIWGSLIDAVVRSIEDWKNGEEGEPPWRVLGDGADEDRFVEIDAPGGRFIVKLAEETPRAGVDDGD
jgi:hypothetical protein